MVLPKIEIYRSARRCSRLKKENLKVDKMDKIICLWDLSTIWKVDFFWWNVKQCEKAQYVHKFSFVHQGKEKSEIWRRIWGLENEAVMWGWECMQCIQANDWRELSSKKTFLKIKKSNSLSSRHLQNQNSVYKIKMQNL